MKPLTRFIFASLLATMTLLSLMLASCAPQIGSASTSTSDPSSTVQFTLKTGISDGRMVFTGVGGTIDGQVNPTLTVNKGDIVAITLIDGDGAQHDITLPDFNAASEKVSGTDSSTTLVFTVDRDGQFPYFCSLPGHRQAGMEGKLISGQTAVATAANLPMISRDPTDLPGPIGNREPQTVRVDLEAKEVIARLADGVSYTYWTFNGKVPGPFIRVRVGDTVEVHLKNDPSSLMNHSVDFHAVTGPGGGAVMTQTPPGGETSFSFKALNPGLFVYHCATPMVAEHIASGMFGMILVEPESGLPKVDREFYVMQSEIYTQNPHGQSGLQAISTEKLLNETPDYYVLNGAVGGLTQDYPLHANTGETVRIFFGVGGPNKISSFHIIGEILDRVYDQASLTSPPLTNVQTTLVPPGGATVVELALQVPGRYLLVDHALSRMERGLMGYLLVDGADMPEVYNGTPTTGSGH